MNHDGPRTAEIVLGTDDSLTLNDPETTNLALSTTTPGRGVSIYTQGGTQVELTDAKGIQITGPLIPATTNVYSLGNPTQQWQEVYAKHAQFSTVSGTLVPTTAQTTIGTSTNPYGEIYTSSIHIGNTVLNSSSHAFPIGKSVSSTSAFGNVVFVDAVNGNDAIAKTTPSVPFATVNEALNQLSPGQVLQILPGVYSVRPFTILPDLTLRGICSRRTILQFPPVSGTLITMGPNTQLEHLTIQVKDTDSVTGIWFPNDTAGTAQVRSCSIKISKEDGSAGPVYGVLADGTKGATPSLHTALTDVHIYLTSSPSCRGVVATHDATLRIRDSSIYASTGIAVETMANANVTIVQSCLYGGTANSQQTGGTLTIG